MRKGVIISIIIVILIIIVGTYFILKIPKTQDTNFNNSLNQNTEINISAKAYTVDQLINLCGLGISQKRACSDLTCEGKTIYVKGYTSQAQLNITLQNPYNLISIENPAIIEIHNDNFGGGSGIGIVIDDKLYFENNNLSKEKLFQVYDILSKKIGGNFIKDRMVIIKVNIERKDCNVSGECNACPRFVIKNLDDFTVDLSGDVTLPKDQLMSNVDSCNQVMNTKNISDECFGYHYYSRGCYYASDIKICPGYAGTWLSYIVNYGLSSEESKEFCLKFFHKGLTANCLRIISQDSSKKECLDFAKNDTYLIAICNLQNGEELKGFSPKTISDFS